MIGVIAAAIVSPQHSYVVSHLEIYVMSDVHIFYAYMTLYVVYDTQHVDKQLDTSLSESLESSLSSLS